MDLNDSIEKISRSGNLSPGSGPVLASIPPHSLFGTESNQDFAFLGGEHTPFLASGAASAPIETSRSAGGYGIWKDHPKIQHEAYPTWGKDEAVPVNYNDIRKISQHLQTLFRFQQDSVENILEYFMSQLESRALRLGPELALRTLHGDYIGGHNANYRKWYFATEMDSEDPIHLFEGNSTLPHESKEDRNLRCAEEQWIRKMAKLSATDYVVQVMLYLLVWGEAGNLRFMPECLCFIFKCCIDYYYEYDDHHIKPEKPFLDHIVTPLYLVLRKQIYSDSAGKLTRRDRDHASVIGYDDINQLFWHKKGIMKIKLDPSHGSELIMKVLRPDRYIALGFVIWDRTFLKTYRETRTWMHVLVNFNRVLSIHLALFWIFTTFHLYPLYTKNYQVEYDNVPAVQVRLTIMSLAGAILTFTSLIAILCESRFSPRRFPGSYPVTSRICALIVLLCLNVAPTVVMYALQIIEPGDGLGKTIAAVHVVIGAFTSGYLIVAAPSKLFGSRLKKRAQIAADSFTADFHVLTGSGKTTSICLWLLVFGSKFLESYFFLTIPLKAPLRELSAMQTQCLGDKWLGSHICRHQPIFVLVLLVLLEFVLFLLDTYLWYVIWNTAFSVFKSFRLGTSIWTPWRSIYSRLPKRIYLCLFVPTHHKKTKRHSMVPILWNQIIIAMYRDHLLSIEQVHRLLFSALSGGQFLEPPFFVSQEDSSRGLSFFSPGSDAKRRIAFFAQSLTLPMPEAREVKATPSFSVLIPHYSEKIILLLKEITQEEDKNTHVTLLEYLKLLYPLEWDNFIQDSLKMVEDECDSEEHEQNELLLQPVGFKNASPPYVLRTRVWALLRAQTLCRTIFGFKHYHLAIKMLYELENSTGEEVVLPDDRLKEIHSHACRKFRIVVAMQRYKYFMPEEFNNVENLFAGYPELQVAYIDEEFDEEREEVIYYSCLVDGFCPKASEKGRRPKFRIRLPGIPILGDGKADNQNHALIFNRGEYLQLIDANQDNYLEECLKIRNVLAEFEEQSMPDPYDPTTIPKVPVAIVGTREYIFSENTGILGDIAAGKEQTFGTLFARTLAQIGGKLHYGHPDFLNTIFMTTRGGVSKAQKGLHLNEDIYAGMMALTRGGRIKHCEYMQCGKGRDLGFTSILNFITKIGAGMGEQILSREYFYLGLQLPLDRLLSFYYAHLGFHLNNYFIIFSIKLFLLAGVNVAALTHESTVCQYDPLLPPGAPKVPANCKNLIPVTNWLEKTVRSILFVFLLSLLPLAIHELAERGAYMAITRIAKHILSLSPFFEVFVCRIYAHALGSDIAIGGAQYIATGRGFATKREKFSDLYTRFGHELLTFGVFVLLLVIFVSLSIWLYSYLFFWFTVSGFIFAPFLFNPGQFSAKDYLVDYLLFLEWLYGGNRTTMSRTWIEFIKIERSKLTGVKLTMKYGSNRVKHTNYVRPSRFNVMFTVILPKLVTATLIAFAYLFSNAQNEGRDREPSFALARILFIALLPIAFNSSLMLIIFIMNLLFGWVISMFTSAYSPVIAGICRSMSVLAHTFSLMLLWKFQNNNFAQTVLGFALASIIQESILQTATVVLLSREVMDQRPNIAWWSGQWIKAGFGWRTVTQPLREYVCKVAEQSHFAADFTVGHLIFFAQIPLLFIPFVNLWHSWMLMWIKPSSQLRNLQPHSSVSKMRVGISAMALVLAGVCFGLLIAFIVISPSHKSLSMNGLVPRFLNPLDQPILRPINVAKGLREELFLKPRTQNRG